MSNQDPYGQGGDWQDPNQQPGTAQPGTGQPQDWQQPGGPMAHQPPPPQSAQGKYPLEQGDIIAMVITFFLPGVGHMMLGQVVKGVAILAATLFTCGGFGLIWIAALVDSYLVARARKYRTLGDWEFFPDYKQAFNM